MSSKPTKKAIITALEELEGLYLSRERTEARQQKEITPHLETFEQAVAPIKAKYEKQLSPVQERIYALEKEVEAGMLASEQEDGTLKLMRVESANLVATASAHSVRQVDPQVFFENVPESQRDGNFWHCITIAIQKAEKLVGKVKLDAIAVLKRTHRVTIEKKA